MKSKIKRLLPLIVIPAFFSAMLALMVSRIVRTEMVQGWVKAPCLILNSGADNYSAKTGKLCKFFVKYHYEYEGDDYTSNRYSISGPPTVCHQVRKLTVKYKPGKSTTCFVNPDNPSESVLNRQRSPMTFVVSGLLALLITALILFWRFGLRYMDEKDS